MAYLTIQELTQMVEEATQSLPGTVEAKTELGGLDGWDSMGLVVFIELVQTQARVELSVHDLRACSSPLEVLELIQRVAAA